MPVRRAKPRLKFGGDKRVAKRNQELRDLQNQIHELQQALDLERLARRGKEQALTQYLTFPHKAMHEVLSKMSALDALRIGILEPMVEICQWFVSKPATDAWHAQIDRAVREVLASGKKPEEPTP